MIAPDSGLAFAHQIKSQTQVDILPLMRNAGRLSTLTTSQGGITFSMRQH